jgi:hypothetical protein
MGERSSVYVFRSAGLAPNGDTVVSAAPLDLVVSVYGGGGLHGAEGLERTFGGAAFFRNEQTGDSYLGVWGARNASRFRAAIRATGANLEVVNRSPTARLVWWSTMGSRPKRQVRPQAD